MTMDPFEEQMKKALRREPPRAGFAARVRRRIAVQEERPRGRVWPWFPPVRWVLPILVCVGMVVTISYRNGKIERARGQAAKQQVYVALRLAGAKMQLAESKVRQFSE